MPRIHQGGDAGEVERVLGRQVREAPAVARPGPARSQGNKNLLYVLGMHRSGTSAMTRLLSLLGDASLPRRLLGPAHGNPHGHWESLDSLEMNDAFMLNYSSAAYDPGIRI